MNFPAVALGHSMPALPCPTLGCINIATTTEFHRSMVGSHRQGDNFIPSLYPPYTHSVHLIFIIQELVRITDKSKTIFENKEGRRKMYDDETKLLKFL